MGLIILVVCLVFVCMVLGASSGSFKSFMPVLVSSSDFVMGKEKQRLSTAFGAFSENMSITCFARIGYGSRSLTSQRSFALPPKNSNFLFRHF